MKFSYAGSAICEQIARVGPLYGEHVAIFPPFTFAI
jgi:hypothetical protein